MSAKKYEDTSATRSIKKAFPEAETRELLTLRKSTSDKDYKQFGRECFEYCQEEGIDVPES